MSRSLPMATPQRTAHVAPPPPSHLRAHSGQQTAASPFPAGGVFASMRAAAAASAAQQVPRTPQPVHSNGTMAAAAFPYGSGAAGGGGGAFQTPAPLSRHQPAQHAPAFPMQTPLKTSASTPSFATPAPRPSPVAIAPPPRTPAVAVGTGAAAAGTGASAGVAAMSEAESAKLMAALQQFVLVALQQKTAAASANNSAKLPSGAGGEVKNYATLLSQLSAAHTDPLALSRWFLALSKSVASLHATHHAALLDLIYAFDYTAAASVRNVDALTGLLVSMCVGGNIQALAPALKTLVKSFIATNVPFSTISAASVSPALYGVAGDTADLPSMVLGDSASVGIAAYAPPLSSATGGSEPPSMDAIHDLVHTALTRLLQLLPSSPTVLFPLLVDLFPHKRMDVTIQLVYVKNLLRVSEYAPSLRDRILTAIIERMIHIDVEIVHATEDDEDEDAESLAEENRATAEAEGAAGILSDDHPELMFAMGGTGATAAAAPHKPPRHLSESRLMANKLDSLMCLMFEYLNLIRQAGAASGTTPRGSSLLTPQTPGTLIANATGGAGGSGNGNSATGGAASATGGGGDLCDEVFSSLLRVFERSVLRTHNSRFLQFLLFYYCSFRHVYAETFLKYLMERGFEVQISAVERQNAALYIASFVARSAFLRNASAIVAFEMLLKWTHAYTDYHIATTQAAMAASAQSSSYTRGGGASSAAAPPSSFVVPEVGPLEASQHSVFYRMCQAVFYIFCYRQDTFRDMRDHHAGDCSVLRRLGLDRLIESPLNPLRYISTPVIEEFVRVNQQLGGIVQCEAIVERNFRLNQSSMLGSAGGAGRGGRGGGRGHHGHNPHQPRLSSHGPSNGQSSGTVLGSEGGGSSGARFDPDDIFFPFDPYQLKHSSAYIDALYISYRQDDEDASEDSEEESSAHSDSDGEGETARGRGRRGRGGRMADEEEDDAEEDDDAGSAASYGPASARLSKPIRIGIASPDSSTGSGRKGRKRKLRLPGHSPSMDGVTSSPEFEAGLSSMSASFSEQLSLAASPALHGGSGAGSLNGSFGANMSFEMDRGSQFLALPPSAVTARAKKGAAAAAASSSSSGAGGRSGKGRRSSGRSDEHKSYGGASSGSRKARKHAHVSSSDDDDEDGGGRGTGFVLSEQDLSFTDSPAFEPLSPVM